MKNLFIALSLTGSLIFAQAALSCSRPTAPEIPDPATAVTPQMIKAKNDVQAYVDQAEKYLKCNISTAQHNSTVDEMKAVAEKFNQAVRDYKARMAG
ncbi:hypothetical protein QWY82_12960 [Simiduia curdlanivorans]|uniref:Uncharacterized protein n=1 Tax=Simiduia curdlanivorans TaxID=1492769 RepID=A0ABV8V7S7_9GAMM|nr:hypothetical protein [Simiduia curdlanivorans]MDN3639708.1 hypothetical protein [Simiduia curdlanivorans]